MSDSLKSLFFQTYRGEVKDPVLDTLLDSLDLYRERLEDKLLLSVYAGRSDQQSDGFYEIFCRHLFGQMFPGPAFVVAQAFLRDPFQAQPLLLEQTHHFGLHDTQGGKALFTPRHATWILPSVANEVEVRTAGSDLQLGFGIISSNLGEDHVPVSLYINRANPVIIERLRCRLSVLAGGGELRLPKPLTYPDTPFDELFFTPFDQRFILIPATLLRSGTQDDDGRIWLTVPGLESYGSAFKGNMFMNAVPMWNFVRKEAVALRESAGRFRIPVGAHRNTQTIIASIKVEEGDGSALYKDTSRVMDPGYPYQYSTTADNARDEIILNLCPPPEKDPLVEYSQYNTSDALAGIPAGGSMQLHQGIDERLRSMQTVIPTRRVEILNDKKRIWDYFRSLFASRSRIVTRDDMRAAIILHPVFAHSSNPIDPALITFKQKVGRLSSGAMTPYTEILVPVRERWFLESPEREFFQKSIARYLCERCVAGCYLRLEFVAGTETRA